MGGNWQCQRSLSSVPFWKPRAGICLPRGRRLLQTPSFVWKPIDASSESRIWEIQGLLFWELNQRGSQACFYAWDMIDGKPLFFLNIWNNIYFWKVFHQRSRICYKINPNPFISFREGREEEEQHPCCTWMSWLWGLRGFICVKHGIIAKRKAHGGIFCLEELPFPRFSSFWNSSWEDWNCAMRRNKTQIRSSDIQHWPLIVALLTE